MTSSVTVLRGSNNYSRQHCYVFYSSAFGGCSNSNIWVYINSYIISLCISIYFDTDLILIYHLSSTMYHPPSTICHPGLPWHQCPCGRDGVGGQDDITFKHTINYRSKRCHYLILYQAFICVAIKNSWQWCGCIDHDSKNILCTRVSKWIYCHQRINDVQVRVCGFCLRGVLVHCARLDDIVMGVVL